MNETEDLTLNTFIGPGRPLKVLIAVIVYNRINNIRRWIKAWHSCQKYMDAKLVVIHNVDVPRANDVSSGKILEMNPDIYIKRQNRGLDVGAFQDLCYGRLYPITDNDWDIVHWWTDDTLPMNRYFMMPYINKLMQPNVGAVGAQISDEVSYHLRTNSYVIRQETCKRLVFPSDYVETKLQCYQFEHAPPNPMTKQLKRMGLNVMQAHKNFTEYAWDTEHFRHLNLWEKFWTEFPDCKELGTEP